MIRYAMTVNQKVACIIWIKDQRRYTNKSENRMKKVAVTNRKRSLKAVES